MSQLVPSHQQKCPTLEWVIIRVLKTAARERMIMVLSPNDICFMGVKDTYVTTTTKVGIILYRYKFTISCVYCVCVCVLLLWWMYYGEEEMK